MQNPDSEPFVLAPKLWRIVRAIPNAKSAREFVALASRFNATLNEKTCESCGRPFYGFAAHARACSRPCKDRARRRRDDPLIDSDERRQNRRNGLQTSRAVAVAKYQVNSGYGAERTWYEMGLIDPAYKALKPNKTELIHPAYKARRPKHIVPPQDEPLRGHPDNIAWVAAWRRRRDSFIASGVPRARARALATSMTSEPLEGHSPDDEHAVHDDRRLAPTLG